MEVMFRPEHSPRLGGSRARSDFLTGYWGKPGGIAHYSHAQRTSDRSESWGRYRLGNS
jgi:hypothetical protein